MEGDAARRRAAGQPIARAADQRVIPVMASEEIGLASPVRASAQP
jgi:hypothetical protein